MGTAPYGVRLLVGAAATAIEETRKLPQTILTYPMTMASQAANVFMHVQQNLAELVVKGDETLEQLFPPKDEQPEWATFDEDLRSDGDQDTADDTQAADGDRRTEGRFALYSTGEPESAGATNGEAARGTGSGGTPAVADQLGYDALTLAQLRARLASLRVADLQALLAYEEAGRARAPFVTLLANRITRATAK
ncbi:MULTISPECIES: lipid droplet-associated protein [unclassified Mycolicibacterium]|uniref:lipid droplet-associated protein n=1 Tax=unclassified Mycolicibacterium TaxID=2636767 RepID=UPI0012DF02E5|nr:MULTISPECIES: lipid droplet-associated protein [unclassified Mycolicibacterium]MUL85110.1 lipid droplet-associated protein [Mycolicibacterium sp. CBMA 329]MUL91077.1 lipid droplet-associated protein [Mycolicibacterium sp. CBMA 331]MUL98252.1 lipid droplet-associated protein [Mycolicibacterium sp. CBMA 334]MUM26130.1 lipid droplet-associated protein [Mycolicibacterium sp. CBMA 295]MUM40836.1 lipid droplet-associated protein [Mycolicibacterium sp. CBMA 247]